MASKNFAISAVATAPSPATTGTSLVVTTGHGTRFPATPFKAVIWPSNAVADPTNAEIVNVTAISTDTFTITRAQESSTARTVVVGDRIAAVLTAAMYDNPTIDGLTINDAGNVVLGTTTGTKIGTSTTQKLALFNATPVSQFSNTTDLRAALVSFGLIAAGGATPLNLNGGLLTAGSAKIGAAASTAAGRFGRTTDADGTFAYEAIAFARGGVVLNPQSGQNIMVWRAPFACTVTMVRGHFKGGTSVVYSARKNQTNGLLTANRTMSTADAWDEGTAGGASLQNTAFAAGDDLEIQIITVTGVVTECSIQVDFTRP